ncbi:TetR-like C-terminal domain-containing protein [Solwaraspora sp. WMMD937]|uniref:TetR-like C-terminal domain-containing protein n=1 Tax=Solwaraspora sp. WMMD937 TaxID=3016090 RepID=UPI00249C593C|nr:TetR-like C-terminal domain-containing protein [Solwaraspora sp. WMMD937]WFE19851.1 TetR-like C-terminal domain-containing protein [Solwaraspora sp. WMMD937]
MSETQARPRRSRLSAEREQELLTVALAMVRERGYDAVTIDDIAAAAKASTATLYRRWESKPMLVIRALQAQKPAPAIEIDTGSLRGDLLALATIASDAARIRDSHDAAMTGLARDVLLNPELMLALRELMIEPQIQAMRRMLQRHVDAGRIGPDNPVLDLVDQILLGPLLAGQLYLGHRPGLAARIVDEVLLPLLSATRG